MASRIMAAFKKHGSSPDLNDLEWMQPKVTPALADSTHCPCWHCPSQQLWDYWATQVAMSSVTTSSALIYVCNKQVLGRVNVNITGMIF